MRCDATDELGDVRVLFEERRRSEYHRECGKTEGTDAGEKGVLSSGAYGDVMHVMWFSLEMEMLDDSEPEHCLSPTRLHIFIVHI